jgi:hypothetical protein
VDKITSTFESKIGLFKFSQANEKEKVSIISKKMNDNILNLKPSISTPIALNSKILPESSGSSLLFKKENSHSSLPVKLSSSEVNLHNSSVSKK